MTRRHWPTVLPLALIAALPFRVPIEVGDTTANLLLPLYLAIGAGTLLTLHQLLRGRRGENRRWKLRRDRDTPLAGVPRGAPPPWWKAVLSSRSRAREGISPSRLLLLLLALFISLYAVQSAYSINRPEALKNLVFFYVPFALMLLLLLRAEWTPRLIRLAFGVVAIEAVAFVLVGFWEFQARELLWNPKVINANQFTSYFRVNSVFWDPNIYGRFLAVAIVLAAAALLWARSTRGALVATGLAGLLLAGLVLTFSQSSFVALLAGLVTLAALRWRPRWTLAGLAAMAAAGALALGAFDGGIDVEVGSSESLAELTSGRSKLVQGGVELALERPLGGHGSGSFARAFRRERKGGELAAVAASHTEPVTVAAEQGAPGLIVYLALVALALLTLLRGRMTVARAAVAAAFVALLVHTLAYAAFLTDPLSWTLLAIGCALAPGGAEES